MNILSQNKKKVIILNGDTELFVSQNNTIIKDKKAPDESYVLAIRSLNNPLKAISVLGYFDNEKIATFVLKKIVLEKKALVEIPEHNFKVDEFIEQARKKRDARQKEKAEEYKTKIETVKPEVVNIRGDLKA